MKRLKNNYKREDNILIPSTIVLDKNNKLRNDKVPTWLYEGKGVHTLSERETIEQGRKVTEKLCS